MKTKKFNMDTRQKSKPQLHHAGKLRAWGIRREEADAGTATSGKTALL